MYFTGRVDLISKLLTSLLQADDDPITVLCGMGGSGKTSLAAIVARLPSIEQRFADGTFWIDLQIEDVMSALDRIACTFGHDVSPQTNLNSRAKVVRSILQDKKTLIVLDNVYRQDEISSLLPHTKSICTLITTRDANLANDLTAEVVNVAELTESESIDFLKKLVGGISEEQVQICREIAFALGYLPLALELAGKLMRKETRKAWFSWSEFGDQLKDEKNRLGLALQDKSIRATFNLSYDRSLNDAGRSLFSWLGLLAPGDLELGVIARIAELSEKSALSTLGTLADLSLIQPIGPSQFHLHPLLHDFAREKCMTLNETTRTQGYQRACDFFYEQAKLTCQNPTSIEDIRPILRSHQYGVFAKDKERVRRVSPWFDSLPIPGFLMQHGHPYTLLKMYEAESSLAVTDSEVAYSEWSIGESYAYIGLYEQAINHLARALDLYKSEHYDLMVAKLTFILAQTYMNLGDFQNAIDNFQHTIKADRIIGHTSAEGLTLTQIGDCYRNMGDYKQALDYYEAARAFCEKVGAEREEAIALIRLAELCWQSDPTLALQYLDRAKSFYDDQVIASEWDSARLLCQIGKVYDNLTFNGQATLSKTISCYWRAFIIAQPSSPYYQSLALYQLGNLLEHIFFLTKSYDYEGAVACYEMADKLSQGMELPPGINPRERMDTRIRPRLEPSEFTKLVEKSHSNGIEIVRASVQRILDDAKH